jgi:Uma2 family endonuclease
MATSAQISLNEYLTTNYRPDREYVDGVLVERNVGKNEHSRLQVLLAAWFASMEDQWQVATFTEWRVQVASTRVRIPDVLLARLKHHPQVMVDPPVLVVEILSPEDNYSQVRTRAADYFDMGVCTVWIIDPKVRAGRWSTGDGVWTQSSHLEVPGTEIYVNLDPLFVRLDQTIIR